MALHHLTIGTRGSKLALIQTELVGNALKNLSPQLAVELVTIKTTGDKNMSPIPLDTVGKTWFTAEIDESLRAGRIDMAVHSLKDLPLVLDPDFTMITVLERADPRDVLISNSGKALDQLPEGSTVGTDSTRRRSLVLNLRPDLSVTSLRGNVQSRLAKLREGGYNAIVLAAAGLDRLGESSTATELLDPTTFIPSIGQGALAVVARRDSSELLDLLRLLEHQDTVITTQAERTFSSTIGGGCKMPVGCYATLAKGRVYLNAMVADGTGKKIHFDSASGPQDDAMTIAETLATKMVALCGFDLELNA